MELWIPVTLAAATAQALRFMLQKFLRGGTLKTSGATFSRFFYSAPLAALGLALYLWFSQQAAPVPNARFWLFALGGGLAQILATLCVVALFSLRNFAVGITLKKTEVLQTALIGFLVLGETVSRGAALAIVIGFVAVVLLSETPISWRMFRRGEGLRSRAIALGLGSGLLFGFSAIGYRGATLALPGDDAVLRAAMTLAIVTASQSLAMGLWLAWRDREELAAVLAAWRVAGLVGITSVIGSFCWFLAFALQRAAYVKGLGQIELILSLAASVLVFHERITPRELAGMALLMVSVLMLVLAA